MIYRISGNIKSADVYQAIEDIIFESPELKNNVWLNHRKEMIEVIENEDARAPPLSLLFDEGVMIERQDGVSLIDILIDEIREKAKKEEIEDE